MAKPINIELDAKLLRDLDDRRAFSSHDGPTPGVTFSTFLQPHAADCYSAGKKAEPKEDPRPLSFHERRWDGMEVYVTRQNPLRMASLIDMPFQCGAKILGDAAFPEYLEELINEEVKPGQLMLYTTIYSQTQLIAHLEDTGWKPLKVWVNPNTKNKVTLWGKIKT